MEETLAELRQFRKAYSPEETDLFREWNTNNRIGLREAESDNEPASQQGTFREVNHEGHHCGALDGRTSVEEPSPAKRDEWNECNANPYHCDRPEGREVPIGGQQPATPDDGYASQLQAEHPSPLHEPYLTRLPRPSQ